MGRVETLNAGVPGYNTVADGIMLRERVMGFHPDLVILGITEINDPEITPFRYRSDLVDRYKQSFWWKVAPVRVFIEWRVYDDYFRASEEFILDLYEPNGPCWPIFVKALTRIRDLCESRGVPLIVICFPLLEDGNTFSMQRGQLFNELDRLGIPFVDPKPELDKHKWSSLAISDKDLHPNSRAHRIFAEQLYDKIMSMGLMESLIREGFKRKT